MQDDVVTLFDLFLISNLCLLFWIAEKVFDGKARFRRKSCFVRPANARIIPKKAKFVRVRRQIARGQSEIE